MGKGNYVDYILIDFKNYERGITKTNNVDFFNQNYYKILRNLCRHSKNHFFFLKFYYYLLANINVKDQILRHMILRAFFLSIKDLLFSIHFSYLHYLILFVIILLLHR